MGRCSSEAWRRLPWVAFISLRLVYVLFFAVACFAFDRVSSLLGKVEVCGLRNSTVSGPACTDMSPVIQGCLMSSVLSFLVIILHTAIELALRARGPMRYLCGETAEYGQGFLAMLRVCIVFVLLQTTVSFLGVAMIVRVIEPYGELSLDPVALARQLRALPLADLLGLSEDYRECAGDRGSRAGGTDDPAPAATVAGDDGAAAVADRASGPPAEVDHLPTANAGGGGDTGDTGAVARSGAGASGEKETRRGRDDGDDDAELDALLDGRDGSAGEESRRERRKHAGPPVPAATTSRDEDDAFLDQLLG